RRESDHPGGHRRTSFRAYGGRDLDRSQQSGRSTLPSHSAADDVAAESDLHRHGEQLTGGAYAQTDRRLTRTRLPAAKLTGRAAGGLRRAPAPRLAGFQLESATSLPTSAFLHDTGT